MKLIRCLIILSLALFSPGLYASTYTVKWYAEQAANESRPIAQRIAFYDTLINHSKSEIPDYCLGKGMLLHRDMQLQKAIDTYDRGLTSSPDHKTRLHLEFYHGKALLASGNVPEAVKDFFNIIHDKKPDSLKYTEIAALTCISNVLYNANCRSYAMKYAEMAEDYFSKLKDGDVSARNKKLLAGDIYNAKGIICLANGDFKNAYDYLKTAWENADDPSIKNIAKVNLGIVYLLQKEYDIASDYYLAVLNDSTAGWYDYSLALINYIDMLHLKGDDPMALQIINGNLQRLKTLPRSSSSYLEYLRLHADILGNMQQPNEALKLFKERAALKDSINSVVTNAILLTVIRDNEERLNADGAVLKDRMVKGCIVAAIIILLLSGIVFLWWRRREKQRSMMSDSLVEIPLIENVLKSPEEEGERRRKSQISVPVYQNFYNKLLAKHPGLTKSELDMCAYYLAGLSTKEIAAATNRSARTVESIKYTLRKKLGITESTHTYLKKLAFLQEVEV